MLSSICSLNYHNIHSTYGGINDWLAEGLNPTSVAPIVVDAVQLEGKDVGTGRVACLKEGTTVAECIALVKAHLKLDVVRVAYGSAQGKDAIVSKVAICAGSGASVVGLSKDADLYLSGEMSHHEVLAATAKGVTVILSEHTLTERGYLAARLKPKLEAELGAEYTIEVSTTDANPILTV